jgi:hypothetical protein
MLYLDVGALLAVHWELRDMISSTAHQWNTSFPEALFVEIV